MTEGDIHIPETLICIPESEIHIRESENVIP
jgi:hypothetical protein